MKKNRFRSCLTVFLALLLTAALFSGCSAAPAEQEQEPQPMTYAERMALAQQAADRMHDRVQTCLQEQAG